MINFLKMIHDVSRIATVIALTCIGFAQMPAAQAVVHPGGWYSATDIAQIRSNVASGVEPYTTASNALMNSAPWSTAQPHTGVTVITRGTTPETGNGAAQSDTMNAYTLAIKWVVSGDIAYADAAIRYLDTYSSTLTAINGKDAILASAIYGNKFAQAAEIVAYAEPNWPNKARAQAMFKNIWYPVIKDGASANWGTAAMSGIMSMGIFCNDQTMIDSAISAYKNGFPSGACAGVTQYIDATGENAESGRDQGHSQGGIAHLLEVAMSAWNQNINLVTYNDSKGVWSYGVTGANRLAIGFEYTAKYNLGNTVPYHGFIEYCNGTTIYPNGISATGRGNYSPVYEMAYRLFTAAGIDAPYCKQVCDSAGYTPEITNVDHPGLGTLLRPVQPANGTYRIVNRNSGQVLEVSSNKIVDGSNVDQWPNNSGTNQRWSVTNLGGGRYKIIGVQSGKSLDVVGNSAADGTNVDIWAYSGADNQSFTLIGTGGGYYRIMPINSSKCVEVAGASTTNGANVQQWSWLGGTGQQWSLLAP